MAETFPTPVDITTSAADALGGTTDERTKIPYLPSGIDASSTPTLKQRWNRVDWMIRRPLAGACQGMAVKTGTLEIGVFPLHYRKADGAEVQFEGGTLALTGSATNWVYVDHATNLLAKSVAAWPADLTTFTPIAKYVCTEDMVTSDAAADRRNLQAFQTHASSAAPTSTTSESFTLDSDNAGAGVNQQVRFNRGSTDAEDAALVWDETSDRFTVVKKHTAGTLCPLNASELQVAGTAVVDSAGTLVAAAIAAARLYGYGPNGDTPAGVRLIPAAAPGAPGAGAHVAGELHVDSNLLVHLCLAAGTPGTWQELGSGLTGILGVSFTMDCDNAGAGVNQQLRFNRGSTDAEDAAVEWDETNDRLNAKKQHLAGTLCPLNASELQVAGTAVVDSAGTLAAAAIAAARRYGFGPNGATPAGVAVIPAAGGGAPAAGAHIAGELHVDVAGLVYVCVSAGTPGTWQPVGKQDSATVVSIGDGAGAAGAAVSCSIQMKDRFGNNVARAIVFDLYLMDDTGGAADAANASAFTATTGSTLRTLTANVAYRCTTAANGVFAFTVVNSIADTVYVLATPSPGSEIVDCSDRGALVWS